MVHFNEMVASAKCAQLRAAALPGAGADVLRVCTIQTPAFFGACQVRLAGVPGFKRPLRPLAANALQLGLGHAQLAFFAHAGRAVAVEGVRQLGDVVAGGCEIYLRGQQAHTAVDIVSNAAGGDHPFWVAGGSHTADGEAISLVHIRHHQYLSHQPWQRGGIHRLFKGFIVHHLFQQAPGGEDTHRDAHILA